MSHKNTEKGKAKRESYTIKHFSCETVENGSLHKEKMTCNFIGLQEIVWHLMGCTCLHCIAI